MTHTTPAVQPSDVVRSVAMLLEEYRVSIPELAEQIGKDRTHLWRVLNGHVPATHDIVSRCLIGVGEIIRERGRS